jgi:pimeloyl-ACP methyl ester carboxylesterase
VCVLLGRSSRGCLPASTGGLVRRDYRVASAYVTDPSPATCPRIRPVSPVACRGAVLKAFAGGHLFGASSGSGTPWVLALHGWRRSHRDFDASLEGVDAVALDLPGFGAAPPPPEPWTTGQYADWIAPVLEDLAPRVVVVGHSFGGRVATHLAAQHPDRVAALVLTGVPLVANPERQPRQPSRPPLAFRVGRALYGKGLIGDRRMEALRQRHGSADYRAATGVMRGVLVRAVNETYEVPMAAYPGPVELVWGQDDVEVPIAVAEAAAGLGRRSLLTICPGAGHLVPTEAPECLRSVILRHRPDEIGP